MRTLLIVKPGWKRYPGLMCGISAFVSVKKYIVCLNETRVAGRKFWQEFFQKHSQEPYFEEMIRYLSSSTSIFIILEGESVIQSVKDRVNEIRTRNGKNAKHIKNIMHASDTEDDAQKEIGLVVDALAHNRLQD